jgi:hypothetical protein
LGSQKQKKFQKLKKTTFVLVCLVPPWHPLGQFGTPQAAYSSWKALVRNMISFAFQHFVADRKIDDELGRTTRFLYDSDHMIREISKFGEGELLETC